MSTPHQRFPRRVYQQGDDPDPRFSLANERTFLAWIRTSLALIAGGTALAMMADKTSTPVRWAAILLMLAGILGPIQAWLSWSRTELAMRLGRPLPSSPLAVPLGVVVMLAGLLVLWTML
ncbi:YidH family protein [Luteococcus sp. Sow4_B9]|uniref:YidH family protein n=1 Tax=Luteococcus sp. Sow4_B9 TaxID=3438792 RepID=UPI003F9E3A17